MIYFIQNQVTKAVKIGYTASDPTGRLRQLQASSSDHLVLLGVMDGSYDDEQFLHERFHAFRMTGEWFAPTQYLMHWIRWLSASERSQKNGRP